MKKAFKITTVVFAVIVGLIIILTIVGLSYFFISTKDVKLDLDKLDGNYSNIQIYDNKNNQIMLKITITLIFPKFLRILSIHL